MIDALNFIEKKHNVSFNYSNDVLENILVYKLKKNLRIELLLEKLFIETNLKFTLLKDGQIIISKKEESEKVTILDEIILNNILTKGISVKKGGKITIRPNEFKILPGLAEPDILQSIQSLPGVLNANKKLSDINIRGGTHDQNLFLWNNIKMYQTGHFFGLISPFNPYLIKEVNLLKNGTSSKYGDGVSSIIEMNNKKSNTKETKVGFGTDLISLDAFLITPMSKKTELQFSARRAYTDVLRTITYNNFFDRIFQDSDLNPNNAKNTSENEKFFFYDISATIYHKFSKKHQLQVNFLNINNNLKYSNTQNTNSFLVPNNLSQNTFAISTDYHFKQNNLKLDAQLFFSKYSQFSTENNLINGNRNQILNQENLIQENGLKLHGKYQFLDRLDLSFGYQLNETGITNAEDVVSPSFQRFIKEVVLTHSLFYELAYQSVANKFAGKIGFRNNYFEKFDIFNFEPRVSLNYNFLNGFKLEFLGEMKSQITSQIIDLPQDFLGVENKRWILSNNDNIPILKSKQVSLALRYKKRNFIVTAETYLKRIDGVTTRSQSFKNQFEFSNTNGNQKSSGLELLVHNKFKNVKTWFTYNFNNNSIFLEGLNNNSYFPTNHDIRHSLSLNTSVEVNQFNFAIAGNWHTGKPFTSINATNPLQTNSVINFNTVNSSNLKNYFRVDFSINYTFKFKGRIGLSIWNLLDTKNILNTYYNLDENNFIKTINTNSLRLTPNISFRVNF
ncbi:MAG: TonB-dependent receptor [Polaribacter sp.]